MRRAIWTLVLVLGFSTAARAREQETEVPFRLLNGYAVLVKGSLGKLKGLNFVIDTGAAPSVVDRRVARQLKLKGNGELLSVFSREVAADRVRLPKLRLGAIEAEGVEALAGDLRGLEKGLGVRVDALIGLDVLARRNFGLEFIARRLVFDPPTRADGEVALEAGRPVAIVRLETAGAPLRVMLDTGARDLILFERRVRGRVPASAMGETKNVSNLGGEVVLRRVALRGARLGGMPLGMAPAYMAETGSVPLPDFDGLLGLVVLDVKRIDFDFDRRTVSWLR